MHISDNAGLLTRENLKHILIIQKKERDSHERKYFKKN